MSSDESLPAEGEGPSQTPIALTYGAASRVEAAEGSAQVSLATDLKRPPVRWDGILRAPLRFREALATLHAIVGSDFRYVPKDRTAYAAYQRLRRESAGLSVWQAQRSYYDWLSRNDPLALVMLDPIVTVHPDGVLFEVFSKDEGAYAVLRLGREVIEAESEPTYGTTNIDFSQALISGVLQMRSYRRTRLSIGPEEVGVATESAPEVIEKSIRVPDTWLRGLLQVQSASSLPMDSFRLLPIDLYNALRQLRMHADIKGKRRGLRFELVPGEPPRIILEPWDHVLVSGAGPYQGRSTRVVRVWGRRRLKLLARFLAMAESIDVHVLGSGLPSFWVLRGGEFTLTLGLTGFTSASWSQAISFDLLLPRKSARSTAELDKVLAHLGKSWKASFEELGKATKLSPSDLREALQAGCQHGRIMYDLAEKVYRLRPLVDEPIDMAKLEYRNAREKKAHDLVERKGAVAVVGENRIAGEGLEVVGKVVDREDDRDYRPKLLINEEGQVGKAECTCPAFRKQGLQHGPCPHLIALRLAYARVLAQRAEGIGGDLPAMETRTYSRRDRRGETVYQVSLEKDRLIVRWGLSGEAMRLQRLAFDTPAEARAAFQSKVAELDARGYLDATMG
jgi:predicted DNA-binding WGR domain protein